jgi:hypothetical protein
MTTYFMFPFEDRKTPSERELTSASVTFLRTFRDAIEVRATSEVEGNVIISLDLQINSCVFGIPELIR